MGCFLDSETKRALTGLSMDLGFFNSQEYCNLNCKWKNYLYSGVENGYEKVGNSFHRKVIKQNKYQFLFFCKSERSSSVETIRISGKMARTVLHAISLVQENQRKNVVEQNQLIL